MASNIEDIIIGEHEVATRLGVSVALVRRWRQRNEGPRTIKYDRAVRYRLSDIIEFRDAHIRETVISRTSKNLGVAND